MNAPPFIPQDVWDEERRNICGHGRPWQLTDAAALVPAGFFLVDGVRRVARKQDRGWALIECILATVMFYFHASRFAGSFEEVCEGICGESHRGEPHRGETHGVAKARRMGYPPHRPARSRLVPAPRSPVWTRSSRY